MHYCNSALATKRKEINTVSVSVSVSVSFPPLHTTPPLVPLIHQLPSCIFHT